MKKKLEKRCGLLFFAALMMVLMISAGTAFAADGDGTGSGDGTGGEGVEVTAYDLWIGGVQVTDANAGDVLGDGGSVKFTPATESGQPNTLTLNNANFKTERVDASGFFGIEYSSRVDLDIVLAGENTISGQGNGIFSYERALLTFKGEGSLYIDGCSLGICTNGKSDVTVKDKAMLNVTSSETGIKTESLIMEDSCDVSVSANIDAVLFTSGDIIVSGDSILEAYSSEAGSKGVALNGVKPASERSKVPKAFAGNSPTDLEPAPWAEDTDTSKLNSYKYVCFPYVENATANITFDGGEYGEGTMKSLIALIGAEYTLPGNGFESTDESFGFDGWMIGEDKYKTGDKVVIDQDTVITACWVKQPTDIFIGGIQLNGANSGDVLGDGKVSAVITDGEGDAPGEVVVTLDNATINTAKRNDGGAPNEEYGLLDKDNNYDLKVVLKGSNKVVNGETADGITKVAGVEIDGSGGAEKQVTFTGEGTLDAQISTGQSTTTYYGFESTQKTILDGADLSIAVTGDAAKEVKGYYNRGSNSLVLKNHAHLMLNTDKAITFDSNKNTNEDLEVEDGSVFEAFLKVKKDGAWGVFHGNSYIKLTESTKALGVLVNDAPSADGYKTWDGTSELGNYSYVRIPDDHEHQWDGGVVSKAPTLKAEGQKLYTCGICNGTKTEPMAKLKANTLTVKAKIAKVKYSKVRKKAQNIARTKVLTVSKAQGTVTYKKNKGPGKIRINAKTGKVTVKKGLKKGTYKVKVTVKAAGVQYDVGPLTKTVTFKVKVK